ncbi:NUDIX hydrolase [Corynebacterium sp. UBA2622]|uniref:NUDIX hydrolase n=1 Tax=Corynebacterium sp. UBA2622 TaxID=1946393 RepID=UPI0025BA454E|nr:CoA pyrophosphatase [Corynebacterium sp. UBA2622]
MADITLTPGGAPGWLAPLVRNLETGATSRYVRDQLARRVAQKSTPDEAAVLMLFSGDAAARERPGDAGVLVTHRTPTLRSHSGQMAFPGGHIDPGDVGPVDAALREAWEETGLERSRVTPLATLDTVTTGGSKRAVRPVLAYSPSPGSPYPASSAETDDVFFAPLSELLDPANRLQVGILGWSGPAFTVNGYLIWGFTGALLDALFDAAGWNEPWPSDRVIPLRSALKNSRNGERHL